MLFFPLAWCNLPVFYCTLWFSEVCSPIFMAHFRKFVKGCSSDESVSDGGCARTVVLVSGLPKAPKNESVPEWGVL